MRRIIYIATLTSLIWSAGCASTGGDSEYESGLKAAQQGKSKQAVEIFSSGVSSYPDHYPMRFELARLEYEAGEVHHLRERTAMRESTTLVQEKKGQQAFKKRREANQHRAKGLPHYQNARKHLRFVVANDEDDERLAWASVILMRCDVFFEDWEEAYENIERAITVGKPKGAKLLRWRNFQAAIKEKLDFAGYGP